MSYAPVLRDAMCTDTADPAGVYVGTRDGCVYASADAGDTWVEVARHLPGRADRPRRRGGLTMIAVRLPTVLRPFAGGAERVEVDGEPPSARSSPPWTRHPALGDA